MSPRRSATSTPGRARAAARPPSGSQRSNTWCMSPVPRVSVRNSVRKPISPRAGTRYSIRTQPVPWLVMCSIRPLRAASSCVTAPTYSSGTSTDSRSTGSWRLPSISRSTTCGWPDGQLEALAAHHLHEHRQLQLAAALHLVGVRPLGVLHAQRDVADELLVAGAPRSGGRSACRRLCPPAARC